MLNEYIYVGDHQDEINKEFEEKKAELHPKVVEIYEASSTEIKVIYICIYKS